MNTKLTERRQEIIAGGIILVIALMLCFSLYFYIRYANRSLNWQDESYYLLNFLYWRDVGNTATLFGAYFEYPFKLLGQSIVAMRVMTVGLLFTASAFLTREVLAFANADDDREILQSRHNRLGQAGLILAGMVASLSYFIYLGTLRSPSYNLLSTITIAICTGSLLRLIRKNRSRAEMTACALLYGAAMGACFFSKPTSALAAALVHAIFFVNYRTNFSRTAFLWLMSFAFLGFLANVVLLQLMTPAWIASLRDGLAIIRDRGGYSFKELVLDFVWDVQRQGQNHLAALLVGIAVGLITVFKARHKITIAIAVFAMCGISAIALGADTRPRFWWPTMVLSCLLFLCLRMVRRDPAEKGPPAKKDLPLVIMLLLMPPAFSFGTNTYVLAHSVIASMFAFSAVFFCLYRLVQARLLPYAVLLISAALLCVPAALTQYRIYSDAAFTFREGAPLAGDTSFVAVGSQGEKIGFDQNAAAALTSTSRMFAENGWDAQEPVIGLVANAPGLLYSIGAKPFGSTWLLGGSPRADASVENLLRRQRPEDIRRAWLITSPESEGGINQWQPMLERLGGFHHQLIGEVLIGEAHPNWPNAARTMRLQIWKPIKDKTVKGSGSGG